MVYYYYYPVASLFKLDAGAAVLQKDFSSVVFYKQVAKQL